MIWQNTGTLIDDRPTLGERLSRNRELVADLRRSADRLERDAAKMRRDADEIERLAELARGH